MRCFIGLEGLDTRTHFHGFSGVTRSFVVEHSDLFKMVRPDRYRSRASGFAVVVVTRITNHKPDVLLLCICKGDCYIFGTVNIHCVLYVRTQFTLRASCSKRVAALVGE